ncbi:unnamed protein product [Leptidea sinapis]|uniref:Odorant receptor n=1 Tax=Leptidea sinapis TaxID=189913 RepID=A0A5E4QS61_9NEOP|nr:unnamed protein product [Leptidea sinapis]
MLLWCVLQAAQVADQVYSCGWETLPAPALRRSLLIMLARAQLPTYFRAYDMLTFNMEMFVSIMQTAYSMYTLLRT